MMEANRGQARKLPENKGEEGDFCTRTLSPSGYAAYGLPITITQTNYERPLDDFAEHRTGRIPIQAVAG